jgi:tetratricopeptide (TPR) repeat protein
MSREPQGREHAWRVLRPILRRGYWPTTALNLLTLANLCEAEDRKAWTWALLSLAAHNDDLKEWLAVAYFRHTQAEGQPEEGLEFLRARFRAHGRLSGEPAETLFDALTAAGRGAEAFAALKEALTLRPHDPELCLFAARAHADHGELEPAITLLVQARGRTHRARWLRAAVKVPVRQGNREEALRLWREVLRLEPDATDAQEAVARLLEALGKPGAARAQARASALRRSI